MAEGGVAALKLHSTQSRNREDDSESIFKMVMLGETGAGKTALIKFLLNYAKRHYRKPFQLGDVAKMPMVQRFSSEKKWESQTVACTKYIANFGSFKIALIDTPGFSDTRLEQREINTSKIIKAVQEEKYVNCVCVVVNGTESRLTDVAREVIKEVTSVLPKSVMGQIVVVCTKTPKKTSLQFSPAMLEEFGLIIPKQCFFYLDNPYAKWEKIILEDSRSLGTTNSDSDKDSDEESVEDELKRNFIRGHKKIEKILEATQNFSPSPTITFGEIYEVSKGIEASIAEIEIEYENNRKVQHKIEELNEYLKANEPIMKTKLHYYTKIVVKATKTKNLVCHGKDCHSNCHLNCDCWFTFLSARACSCIKGGKCNKCFHPVTQHKIAEYCFDQVQAELPIKEIPDFKTIAESVKGKKNLLDIEKSYYDKSEKVIDELTETLKAKLVRFQGIGTSCHFSKTATDKIKEFKEEVQSITNYKHNGVIQSILDDTLALIKNPLTTTDEDIKFRWACGYLEINPENPDQEYVSKMFRRQARMCHPDTGARDEESNMMFNFLNHAKDCLLNRGIKFSIPSWLSKRKTK